MRNLTNQESQDIIDIDGCQPDPTLLGRFIEAKVSELSAQNIGTACGGPDTFHILNNKGFHARIVRGYLIDDPDEKRSYLMGMICIKVQTENTALRIERIVGNGGSYIRYEGEADSSTTLNGFMIFEDE